MTAWAGLVTVACCSAAIIRLTTVRAIRRKSRLRNDSGGDGDGGGDGGGSL